jgi:hypothetical protein
MRNLVVDATPVAVNNPQIQQENKYQCGFRRNEQSDNNNRDTTTT